MSVPITTMHERIEIPCPACAEPILAHAKRCKHCGVTVEDARACFAPRPCAACGEMAEAANGTCEHCAEPMPAASALPSPAALATATAQAPIPLPASPATARMPNGAAPQRAGLPLQVSFGQAVSLGYQQFQTLSGRATRGEYWWFYLYAVLVWMGVNLLMPGIIGTGSAMAGLVVLALLFAVWIPQIALATRRLHDTNRSGWWQLLVFTLIGAIPLLIWLASKGDDGPNRFGPPRTQS